MTRTRTQTVRKRARSRAVKGLKSERPRVVAFTWGRKKGKAPNEEILWGKVEKKRKIKVS